MRDASGNKGWGAALSLQVVDDGMNKKKRAGQAGRHWPGTGRAHGALIRNPRRDLAWLVVSWVEAAANQSKAFWSASTHLDRELVSTTTTGRRPCMGPIRHVCRELMTKQHPSGVLYYTNPFCCCCLQIGNAGLCGGYAGLVSSAVSGRAYTVRPRPLS